MKLSYLTYNSPNYRTITFYYRTQKTYSLPQLVYDITEGILYIKFKKNEYDDGTQNAPSIEIINKL